MEKTKLKELEESNELCMSRGRKQQQKPNILGPILQKKEDFGWVDSNSENGWNLTEANPELWFDGITGYHKD